MLYKKNLSKELSNELFENPTSEYRGAPFWSWNCKMTPEILNKQIDYLKEMGFGGFHIHSRDGMDNAYLGDEFMSLVSGCVEKAKNENMLAWLYDEDRWPSGAAGGLVTKDPEYRARKIIFISAENIKKEETKYNFSQAVSKTQAIKEGKPYYIATYDVILDNEGFLKSYKVINKNEKALGNKWFVYCATQPMVDWHNGYCYLDTLSKKAVKRFIEVTHERYKEIVGNEFDKVVPAIFTDEPQFARKSTFERPFDKNTRELPWTPDFPLSFKKAFGDDIVSHLPELFWDLPNGKVSINRYRFHDHICERFTEAFSKECGTWCKNNKLPLTGHMMEEPTLLSQTASIGEAMRAYKYFSYPGIDMLCNWVELTTAKQTQSVVHQYGKEAMLSELYGVTNWDFDFRGHKFQGDWQAALGVTIRVPHLSWVSMKGTAKRDYPASINYQSPWYKEYKFIENHFSRVNTALTRGKPLVKIAVVHPIESYWLHWGPGRSTIQARNQLEENFQNLIKWLLFNQLDFNYICESLLPDACAKGENPLKVGKMKYDVVVVPALETIRQTTVERLLSFVKLGGRVIFMGDCPKYVDCGDNSSVKELYKISEKIPFDKNSIVNALDKERILEIRGQNGGIAEHYIYQMRVDGKSNWLFVANASKEIENFPNGSRDTRPAEKLYFKIKGKFTPKLYDTINGKIKNISFEVIDGFTYFDLDAYLFDSFLFRLDKYTVKSFKVEEEKYDIISNFNLFKKIKYLREEPNVLLLDIAEWKWDNEKEYQPLEEMRRLDKLVRLKAGIPPKSGKQPWCLPLEVAKHTVTLRFSFNSEIDLYGAEFACEDIETTDIYLDGVKIKKNLTGYFTDESISKVMLPKISIGKHYIEITRPLASRTYNENCFLLGDFNVKLEGVESTIIKPSKEIGFGSITSQGLPFYGGNIVYYIDVDIPEDGSSLKIHSNYYRGALINVYVDNENELAGRIVFNPYNVIIDNLSKGKHTIRLKLFGNRHNSFGALHNSDRKLEWFGPEAWYTEGDSFSYEYQLREMGILNSPKVEIIKKKF